MNKEELNESLQFVVEEDAVIETAVYAKLKEIEEPQKLDIESNDLPDIASMFVASIKTNIIDKEDYSILPLSTADERGNCFYQYDLDIPDELSYLESVIGNDNLVTFDFTTNSLDEIESLLIVMAVGDSEISIYKKVSPVEIIGRGGFILKKAAHRMERMNEQLLRISSKFQIIHVNNELIILDLNAIEKSFGFHDVIRREAAIGLTAIEDMHIVRDMETLRSMITDITFARKLTKVARSSPVLRLEIPNESIIAFSQSHPATQEMKYSDNNTKFDLTSKKLKNLFIRILNDDLLTSELTNLHYASLAKDGFQQEFEVNNEEQVENQ